MDLKITDVTPQWIWFQMALFNIVILPFLVRIRFQKGVRNTLRYSTKPFKPLFLALVALLLCIFATYDGDWFSYWDNYRDILKSMATETQMEPVYVLLANFLTFDNYLLFRVEIWGLAIFFYYQAFKRYGVNTPLMWTGFLLTTLINFAYMRGVLGFSIALYGYTFLMKPIPRNKMNSYLIGFLILLASLLFHKSMYIVVMAAFLSLVPVKRWVIISIPVLLPVFIALFEMFVVPMIGKDSAGAGYLDKDYEAFGLARALFNYMNYFVTIGTVLLLLIPYWKNEMPKYIRHSYYFVIYILVVYAIVFFVFEMNGIGGKYLSNRIFLMIFCMFPLLFNYQLQRRGMGWQNLCIIFVAYLAVNYDYLYSYYLQLISRII